MYDSNNLKGTGRTTRMIEYAKTLALYHPVVIIVATRETADILQERVREQGIRVFGQGVNAFDWETLKVAGFPPDTVVLVDHWAIEKTFGKVLEMLHRFDKEGDDEPRKA